MENKEIKVSVIIPVFNTEKYVREAVESMMNQTLQELEIIIINDGSTDNSLQVVERLAVTDHRIQVYSQANQGGSAARNAGIAKARGKFIYFMDSDDLLEKETMELCYRKCEEEQLDFVFFDAETLVDGNIENAPALSYKHTHKLEDKVYTGLEAFHIQLRNNEFTPSPCLSFIRRSFLQEYHIRFYPGIIHEDQLFTVTLYLQAGRVGRIPHSFFHRRIRENSIMTRRFSFKNVEGYLTVTQEILRLEKQIAKPGTEAVIDLYLSQMLNAAIWQAHTLKLSLRLRLALTCFFKYRKYISARTIGVLLFKAIIHR